MLGKVVTNRLCGNSTTHSLKHVGKGETFGSSTLQLSKIISAFLPSNVTSVVQPLD